MRVTFNDKQHGFIADYDSLSEYVAAALGPVTPGGGADDRTNRTADSWSGNVTLAEAAGLASTGWQDGLRKMVAAMATASPRAAVAPAYVMDVAGAYPMAAAAAAGAPDCMVCPLPVENRVKPVVRLAVNTWASCMYEAPQYTVFGAALASYIDALESAGYRLELIHMVHCEMGSGRNPRRYTTRAVIKRAEQPLEMDRLAFALMHPAMLRMIGFQHMAASPVRVEIGSSCGYPAQAVAGVHYDAGNTLYLPGINMFKPSAPELRDVAACAAAIEPVVAQQLAEYGVEPPALAFTGRDSMAA
jgi:hypothetical protein